MKSLMLAVVFLGAFQGCKPALIPLPTPPLFNTGIVAMDDLTRPLLGASCSIEGNVGETNADGYRLVFGVLGGQRVAVCTLDGYEEGATAYDNNKDQNVFVSLKYINQLPRLQVQGQHFTTANGPFTAIEASDFRLYAKFLAGEDIKPILQQRKGAGFNMVRVFGMMNGTLGQFIPSSYGDAYYTSLQDFYRLLAHYGLYGEFTVFADTTHIMPDSVVQLAHWGKVVNALVPIPNALLEAVNEADQPINHVSALNLLPRPEGVISSHGSNGSQAWPPTPHWDYATFHTNDAPEWVRKVGHNAMEIWAGPTIANENTRAPDRFNTLTQAYDAAAGATLLAAGSCFHSVHGRSSELWDDQELSLATTWATGASSVPLQCQDGPYRHRADLEVSPSTIGGFLRVYQRGDDPTCLVTIR